MTTHSDSPPISVLLADDQAMVRAGFRMIIESQPDMTVVGETDNGRAAVDLDHPAVGADLPVGFERRALAPADVELDDDPVAHEPLPAGSDARACVF